MSEFNPFLDPEYIKCSPEYREAQQQKEEPTWQFRDQILPSRLVYLLRDKVISSTDLLLIFIINTLVKTHTEDSPGLGCYASNSYLAKSIGVHPMHISARISKLINLGLLVSITYKKQRYLELEWSRIGEELECMDHEYGILLRKARARMFKKKEKKDVNKDISDKNRDNTPAFRGGKGQHLGELKVDLESPPKGQPLPIVFTVNNNKEYPKNMCAPQKGGHSDISKPIPSFPEINIKENTAGKKLAKKLYIGLKKKRKIMGDISLKSWSISLNKLVKNLSNRDSITNEEAERIIDKTIDIHIEHINDEYWPKLYAAETFKSSYLKIENAISRLDSQKKNEEEDNLRIEAEEAYRETGFSVDSKGNIRMPIPGGDGRTRVIPIEDEDNYSELLLSTRRYAEYIREKNSRKRKSCTQDSDYEEME